MKVLKEMDNNSKIPINCSIDNIIGGGVERGCLTQFYGPPGSGKTNIALNLLLECVKNGNKAIFVDTEGGLSIERFKQISGHEFDIVAGDVMVLEPKTFQEQDESLRRVENILESGDEKVDLVILDSAVALYRLKEGDLTQLNRELGKQMGLLSRIARKYNVAVVITNQIYSVFGDDGSTSMIAPVGGTILKYWSKIMVELSRGDVNGERYAILKRHRSRPEGLKARFKIVNDGLI
ncbi:MAG: DNA repair and recombination protein RadB [Methanobacterium sp.]|nr:DNA repair and recombination protein RadB [Methanobacterium sp.]